VALPDDAPSIVVRDARPEDAAAINAIYNQVLASSSAIWRDDPEPLEERRALIAAKAADGWPVLVATIDAAVVGFDSVGPFRPWPGYHLTVEHTIHVEAAHRGRGVGDALLRAMIERLRSMGKAVLIAGLDAGNHGSERFHQRFGFRRVAHLPGVGRKAGQPVDLVLLQLDL
jgi:L-amino acid N-acyltransferase YncA